MEKNTETGDFKYDLGAIVIGTDLVDNQHHTLGFFVGGGTSDMDEHDHINQSIEATLFQTGFYHQFHSDNEYTLSSTAAVFYGDYDSKRSNIVAPAGQAYSKSDFSHYGLALATRVAKSYATSENTRITPSAGISASHLEQDKIKESGGGTNYDYHIEQADAQAIVASLGADFSYQSHWNETPVLMDIRLRYEYDAYANKNKQHDIKAGLDGQPKQRFIGQNRGPHGMVVGVGLESHINNKLRIAGGYLFAVRSEGREHSVGANLNYLW